MLNSWEHHTVQHLLSETSGLHFSLDKVAAKAGLSKGGLLYHFATKELLLSALIVDYVEQLDVRVESLLLAKDLPYHLAYIKVCSSPEAVRASRVLVAVSAINEELLEPMESANKRWRQCLALSLKDDSKGLALSLVMDGYLLSALNEHSSISQQDLTRALTWLL